MYDSKFLQAQTQLISNNIDGVPLLKGCFQNGWLLMENPKKNHASTGGATFWKHQIWPVEHPDWSAWLWNPRCLRQASSCHTPQLSWRFHSWVVSLELASNGQQENGVDIPSIYATEFKSDLQSALTINLISIDSSWTIPPSRDFGVTVMGFQKPQFFMYLRRCNILKQFLQQKFPKHPRKTHPKKNQAFSLGLTWGWLTIQFLNIFRQPEKIEGLIWTNGPALPRLGNFVQSIFPASSSFLSASLQAFNFSIWSIDISEFEIDRYFQIIGLVNLLFQFFGAFVTTLVVLFLLCFGLYWWEQKKIFGNVGLIKNGNSNSYCVCFWGSWVSKVTWRRYLQIQWNRKKQLIMDENPAPLRVPEHFLQSSYGI